MTEFTPSGIRLLSAAMILRAAKDLHFKKHKETAELFFTDCCEDRKPLVMFFCKLIGIDYDEKVYEKVKDKKTWKQVLLKRRGL